MQAFAIFAAHREPTGGAAPCAPAAFEKAGETLICGFAARAIDSDPELREYFGITEIRKLDSCLIVGHTDLTFHRTAPRKPAQVLWR